MNTKECRRCHSTFSVTEFYKSSSNKDGLNSKCISCLREIRETRRKLCPKGCGREVAYLTKACRLCHGQERNTVANNQTLADLIRKNGKNKGRIHADSVRWLARKDHSNRLTSCEVCGYSEHVDISHIKDVQYFAIETTIKEINASENVVALCKLHHWEYDNGYIFEKLDSTWKPKTNKKASRIQFL